MQIPGRDSGRGFVFCRPVAHRDRHRIAASQRPAALQKHKLTGIDLAMAMRLSRGPFSKIDYRLAKWDTRNHRVRRPPASTEKLRRKRDARQTRDAEARRHGGACDGFRFGQGVRARHHVMLPFDNGERPLVKYPQKRPMIGLTSRPPQLETPFSVFNDGPITPNNAFFVRYHLAGMPLDHRSRQVHAGDQGQGRSSAQAVAEGHQEAARGRTRRRQSMLGQQPRIFRSARRRRSIGQRRDGQCALARRAAEDRARHGRRAAGRQAGHLQRHGRTGDGHDAGFRQGARYRPRPRRRGDAGLRHERRGPAVSQRLSAAPGRARLLRHLLGQAPQRNHRDRQRVRRLLDEDRLPDSGHALRLRRAGHRAEGDDPDQPLHGPLLHHQRDRRRETESRARRRS